MAYMCVMSHLKTIALLGLSILSAALVGQDSLIDPYKPEYNILPVVYYLPETGLGFGAGGVVSFRLKNQAPSDKPSQIQVAASYTLQNQILLYFPYRLFWRNNKYLAYGELGYYKYTYNYYGIGAQTLAEDVETYDLTYPRIRASFLYQFFKNTYLGFRYWYDDFNITRIAPNGILDTTTTLGRGGGAAAGLGAVLNYESRNSQFYPTKGWFIEGVVLPHFKEVGSKFSFIKLSLDASTYLKLFKNHIVAFNGYAESNMGEVPFYQLAFAGGNKRLRGYYEGRYRDNHALIAQVEYRWMFYKRFGFTVFYGAGSVAPTIADYSMANVKHTFGGGIRFKLSKREKLNIRLDYGLSADGESNFYFTFGEAF